MPLTKRDVEALEPGQIIWDQGRGSVTGLGARRQRRTPVFVLKYEHNRSSRWLSIGKFGSPWTVENARVEARRLLGLLASGIDPASEKREREALASDTTVAEFCDAYLAAAKTGGVLTRFKRPKKASTLAIDAGRIERHIKPLIGSMPLKSVDRAVVRKLISDITEGRTATDVRTGPRGRAIVSGGAGTAARVADLLSGMLTWAVEHGHLQQNPVHGAKRYRGEARDRFLSFAELGRLGRALSEGRDERGSFHRHAIPILTLLALTGCRLGEISGLRWDEVDAGANCLRLADTKTGKSMRAIGPRALEIIEAQPRTSSDYVFPADRGAGAYQGTKKEARRVMAAARVDTATCHTLRHTFASVAAELGYADATIGGLLGHKGRTVTSRYIKRPDAALIAAATATSERVFQAMFAALSSQDAPDEPERDNAV